MRAAPETSPAAVGSAPDRLNRRVLVSNLVAGAMWLAIPAGLGSWPLSLLGAVYVVPTSMFLAAAYAGGRLPKKAEALVWATPWLAAGVLWAGVLVNLDGADEDPSWLSALVEGLVIAAPCYLGWQILALAVRRLLIWRHK
ncbi:hypothetical protein [Nocardioides pacificus]